MCLREKHSVIMTSVIMTMRNTENLVQLYLIWFTNRHHIVIIIRTRRNSVPKEELHRSEWSLWLHEMPPMAIQINIFLQCFLNLSDWKHLFCNYIPFLQYWLELVLKLGWLLPSLCLCRDLRRSTLLQWNSMRQENISSEIIRAVGNTTQYKPGEVTLKVGAC